MCTLDRIFLNYGLQQTFFDKLVVYREVTISGPVQRSVRAPKNAWIVHYGEIYEALDAYFEIKIQHRLVLHVPYDERNRTLHDQLLEGPKNLCFERKEAHLGRVHLAKA